MPFVITFTPFGQKQPTTVKTSTPIRTRLTTTTTTTILVMQIKSYLCPYSFSLTQKINYLQVGCTFLIIASSSSSPTALFLYFALAFSETNSKVFFFVLFLNVTNSSLFLYLNVMYSEAKCQRFSCYIVIQQFKFTRRLITSLMAENEQPKDKRLV